MKNTILSLILFTILFSAKIGVSQVNLSFCNLPKVSFTPILNQHNLPNNGTNSASKIPLFVSFQEWPTLQQKTALEQLGLEFLQSQYNKTALVRLPLSVDLQLLKANGIQAYQFKQDYHKLNCAQWEAFIGDHTGTVLKLNATVTSTSLQAAITDLNGLFYVKSCKLGKNNSLELEVTATNLKDILELSYVEYIEPVYDQLTAFNFGKGRHGLHFVQSVEGLTGQGVTIGVGDNGKFDHLDGRNRVINNISFSTTHGNNICGLIAGGGIINPKYAGYAPKSDVIAERYDDIIDNSGLHYANNGMVITNNAYGTPTCSFNGWYSTASRNVDVLCVEEPNIFHVFASGNGGFDNTTCGYKGCGFGSVPGGFQSSKNVITVGNLVTTDEVHVSSSKGPTRDGRIKPEICARGHEAIAPGTNNNYNLIGGTSSASSAVSGCAAILVEQYRNQFNTDPPNILLKSILCASADDLGNPGPDYTYGFGRLNLINAVNCLKDSNFFLDSITNGQSSFKAINVPQNTKLLKINLYWNDDAGPVYSSRTLVNDLDIELLPPNASGTKKPLILDTNAPDKYALPGRDSINNIEQVVIPNPVPGLYIARINGVSIPSNKVDFVVSYSLESNNIRLTNPVEGQSLVPGESFPIFWESLEDCFPYTLEYSTDNGASWVLIADNLDPESSAYQWIVPDVSTANARIRLSQAGQTVMSGRFNIYYQTTVRAFKHCSGNSVKIEWDTIQQAGVSYEIWLLDVNDTEMGQIATVQGGDFVYPLAIYQSNQDLWFAVVPVGANNERGPRSIAVLPVEDLFEEPGDFQYTTNLLTVDFEGFARPPSNQAVTYNWEFGDGFFATGQQVSHTYLNSGQFYVKLIVLTSCNSYTVAKTIYISNDNSCLVQDSLQLVKLYNQTDGANWTNPWTLTNPVSSWNGVYLTSSGCHVNILQLSNRSITGKLPNMNLPQLEILNLTNNSFHGKLPEFKLPALKNLYASNNYISDTLPHFTGNPVLEIISLDQNQLTGSIPELNLPELSLLLLNENSFSGDLPSFTLTPKLTTLNLAENALSGTIPNFNFLLLENLHLDQNNFTGAIPSFNSIPELRYLYIHQNQLTGSLPTLLNCPFLVEFFAYSNRLTGTIPDYNLDFVTSLFLHNNQLTGSVPNFNLPLLQNLFLYNNQLSGALPALDSIPFISKLNLSQNKLGGTIPSFGNSFLSQLLLNDNQFTGNVPDLTGLGQLTKYQVYHNNLTFAGMKPNRAVIDDFLFAPQGVIPVFINGDELSVQVGDSLSQNTYEWFRNGAPYALTTGDSTLLVTLPGTYHCKVTNAVLSDFQEHLKSLVLFSEKVTLGNPIQFNLKVMMEGPYELTSGAMNSDLISRSLLRGQLPGTTGNSASPIPSAHPYQDFPWSYLGSEGGTWTDTEYTALSINNGNLQIVDWVLVSLRTQPDPASTVARTAAVLFSDGSLYFPNENIVPAKFAGIPYYVLIEHRNHMGVMTPQPIPVFNDVLTYDFTAQDSYAGGISFGSKEIQPGLFVMYAGEGYNTGLKVSYDINGNDKSLWLTQNGFFGRYRKGDYNLDGDVNGGDRILWEDNNGVYSSVKRYYP